MDTAKRYLRHFCNFEKLGFQTEKHGSHRMYLTASQLPTAKATGSSWCIVCIEPTDSERVKPSNRKCKLVGTTNSSKQKQRAVKTLTLLVSQDTLKSFLLVTLVSFENQLKVWSAWTLGHVQIEKSSHTVEGTSPFFCSINHLLYS